MTDNDLRILSDAITRVVGAVSALDMRLTRLEEQHRAEMEQVVLALLDGQTETRITAIQGVENESQ